MLFEQRRVSSQLQGFWHSFLKFQKNGNVKGGTGGTTGGTTGHNIRSLFIGRRRKICFKKKRKKEKPLVGVAFFSAAQFLASLQWQNTAYKKKKKKKQPWFSLPHTHTHTHRAIHTGTHSPGCSRTAESRHSGKHRSYDPPSPSFYSSSSPSPLNSKASCKQACS